MLSVCPRHDWSVMVACSMEVEDAIVDETWSRRSAVLSNHDKTMTVLGMKGNHPIAFFVALAELRLSDRSKKELLVLIRSNKTSLWLEAGKGILPR
jgi:hypothetical protein